MSLASYQQWKLINENFGSFALGVGTPATVGGVIGSVTSDLDLEEGKKCGKCSKKMGAEGEEEPEEELEEEPKDKPEPKDKSEDKPEEDEEDDGDEEEGEEGVGGEKDPDITKKPMLMKKKMKSAMKKMTKEDQEWFNSVHNMLLSDPDGKAWDGFRTIGEDALIAPNDPNVGLTSSEPQAGQPGFAPQGRIGSL